MYHPGGDGVNEDTHFVRLCIGNEWLGRPSAQYNQVFKCDFLTDMPRQWRNFAGTDTIEYQSWFTFYVIARINDLSKIPKANLKPMLKVRQLKNNKNSNVEKGSGSN